ncbi:MAG: NADH-quinone oxidoreductase subunit [Gaiellaceae bacterium]|nr:NADH-quinone oxidoreductase subunit [Gaiellaceae bacterium]
MTFTAPHIDYAGLSPVIALTAGIVLVLAGAVLGGRRERVVVSTLSLLTLAAAAGLCIWQWGETPKDLVAGALRMDGLGLAAALIAIFSAAFVIPLSWREESVVHPAGAGGHGEFQALLLSSVLGMTLLAQAQNLIAAFVALELLSVPLYALCGSSLRREKSLESGLKYLIVGSLGSATLLYGLALIYGATGSTDFVRIAAAIHANGGALAGDVLLLAGIALVVVGLAFKASSAPFHQWTPDVYEGAPTPVTAFMAVATKAAALGIMLRLFDVALVEASVDWAPILAVLAAVTIVVGNIGALGQSSLKRLLAYSSVAQAGYMLAGVVVASRLGVQATVFYLATYLVMNLAAFAVIIARERETPLGDSIDSLNGIGASRPWLAWPMTIAMLGLAGIPATAGFVGKFYLIDAAVAGDYAWLGVFIVVGSMISLAYYLKVIAAMWMRPAVEEDGALLAAPPGGDLPALAGASEEATGLRAQGEVVAVAVIFGAATLVLGIVPQPVLDLVRDAGAALGLF